MKQANNNEIDLLLRSLARSKQGDSPLDTPGVSERERGAFSDHLDADELNSFAEGVVPAPARTRYIAHLADCGSCRAIVVDLTRASGATVRSENPERQNESGFWQNFAALFSAPVLRYAIPALALTAVIGISFFALRQQHRSSFVALNDKINSAAPVPIQQSEPSVTQSNSQSPAKTAGSPEFRTVPESTADKKTAPAEKFGETRLRTEASELDAPAPTPSLNDAVSTKQASAGGLAGAKPPVFAPEPPPPPPAAKPAVGEDKPSSLRKEELARREVQALPVEAEKNQPRDESGRHGPSRSNTPLSASKRVDGLMNERAESRAKSKKDSDDEVDTRAVSGKRFRRQGNAWIDTAYDSSRRTINISRGSEQFRALVADEPAIRTIAEKLSGIVIVVWNGRAYRIQ